MNFKQRLLNFEKTIIRYRRAEKDLLDAQEYVQLALRQLQELEKWLKNMYESPEDYTSAPIDVIIKEQLLAILCCQQSINEGKTEVRRLEKKMQAIQLKLESMGV